LDAYLLWEFSKKTVQRTLEKHPVNVDYILGSMGLAREVLTAQSYDVKMKMARLFSPNSNRVRLLQEKNWSLEAYPVSMLGTVLPCVGDLPAEVIVGSFIDVANYVRQDTLRNLSSVRYIRSLSAIVSILETVPAMVVEPGSEQTRLDVMVGVLGKVEGTIYSARGYIEDGNHRALALMFSNPNRKTLPCWVGRPLPQGTAPRTGQGISGGGLQPRRPRDDAPHREEAEKRCVS
jgi:hypothetical protein